MKKHVVIVGAGFAGLELATRLSESLLDAVHVTLIDQNDSFYFGFSKLDVLLGREAPTEVLLQYRNIAKDGVEFRQETVTAIDPLKRRVITDESSYDADFLVVALGAEYDLAATSGFEQGGFEYYSLAGAERLRAALADFTRGRVLISVLGHPFKCPPAPFEGAFLLHDLLVKRGVRDAVDIRMTFPMAAPVPVTGEVSKLFFRALDERGIQYAPKELVVGLDPRSGTARLASGGSAPYDLFIGIPVHRAPAVVKRSGLAPDGWVPVDQTNLRTRFPGVYALGDVTTGDRTVAKAGIFAEAAARVVAQDITARVRGPTRATALATSSSAAAWSERSRSTSWAAQPQPHEYCRRPASSPSRRQRSPRPGGKAGSVVTSTSFPRPREPPGNAARDKATLSIIAALRPLAPTRRGTARRRLTRSSEGGPKPGTSRRRTH
jgi:sulfide:quinone oxidoreductase